MCAPLFKNVIYKKTLRNIFIFKKFTKLVWEKQPLLQLDCNEWNYTQIYTEENGPNNRLINKEKNQTIRSTNFKGGTCRKPIGFAIKPWLMLTKHKQLCTIVTLLPSADASASEFFKSKDIRKKSLHF